MGKRSWMCRHRSSSTKRMDNTLKLNEELCEAVLTQLLQLIWWWYPSADICSLPWQPLWGTSLLHLELSSRNFSWLLQWVSPTNSSRSVWEPAIWCCYLWFAVSVGHLHLLPLDILSVQFDNILISTCCLSLLLTIYSFIFAYYILSKCFQTWLL